MKEIEVDPKRAFRSGRISTVENCRRFLYYCSTEIDSDPRRGARLAPIAVRFAFRVNDSCMKARSFAVLANAHRSRGLFEAGIAAIKLAKGHSKHCGSCTKYVHRIESYLLLDKKDLNGALSAINRSLELHSEDDDPDDEGKALLYRGAIYYDLGMIRESTRDIASALSKLCPRRSGEYRAAALRNLTTALASGTIQDVLLADHLVPVAERELKGVRRISIERAKFRWTRGLISYRLGFDNRALSFLGTALKMFVSVKAEGEVLALFGHIARVVYPDRAQIREYYRKISKLDFLRPESREELLKVFESTRSGNPFEEGDSGGRVLAAITRFQGKMANVPDAPLFLEQIPDARHILKSA